MLVMKPGDNQTLNVSDSAVGFSDVDTEVTRAMFAIETGSVRCRWDGTDPTASVGYPMAAGTHWSINGRDLIVALKFIRQTDDAVVSVAFMKGM